MRKLILFLILTIGLNLTLLGQKAQYDTIKDNHYVWMDTINLTEARWSRDLTRFEVDLLNDSVPTSLVYRNHCIHKFVEGPFYIIAAVSWEEPNHYSPSGRLKIEYCKKCGVLKLPDFYIGFTGLNLDQGKDSIQ